MATFVENFKLMFHISNTFTWWLQPETTMDRQVKICSIKFIHFFGLIIQRMVDGSASKPVLRQDTGYMVENI